MIFIYTFALWLLLPYIFIHLFWRAYKQPDYLRNIGERFGFYSIHCNRPVIWLHCVSVGETRATNNLVNHLGEIYPNHQILFTHSTPTGRSASEQLFGGNVKRVYLPYDYPFSVKRFLNTFKPQLGILMETEIWINLIHSCHKRNIPLLLINARLSEKSMRHYSRFANLSYIAMRELSAISAQTAADASRFSLLGAQNVSVMGNLKFDIEPPSVMLELGKQLRQQWGSNRPVLLAASTRDGEETLLLDAFNKINVPNLILVIVPRHPQRFTEVSKLIKQHGFKFQRRSDNHSLSEEIQIVLGDSMGEMFAYFVAADLAFVGGSLLPYGGQNLIEACAVGTPVLVGPHMYNFTDVAQRAVLAGAAIQVNDISDFVTQAQALFQNPDALHYMGKHGVEFVNSNIGATKKSLLLIKQHLVI